MNDHTTLVRAKARLKIIYQLGKPIPVAIITNCPLCGGRHVHGASAGPRVAHCANVRGNYFLDCREEPTMMEGLWARVSPMFAKAQLWFELKIMLPVLYKLNSRHVWW